MSEINFCGDAFVVEKKQRIADGSLWFLFKLPQLYGFPMAPARVSTVNKTLFIISIDGETGFADIVHWISAHGTCNMGFLVFLLDLAPYIMIIYNLTA